MFHSVIPSSLYPFGSHVVEVVPIITGAWVPQNPFFTFLKSPFFKFPSKIPVEHHHFELRWSNRNPIYPPA